jgi:hypothetical protein
MNAEMLGLMEALPMWIMLICDGVESGAGSMSFGPSMSGRCER